MIVPEMASVSGMNQVRTAAVSFAVVFAFGAAISAQAAVYKCTDAAGKTTYSDLPCDSSGKPLKLGGDSKGSATDPHMCAQLLDELNRLAAEADRGAKAGRAQSASSTNRRKSLTKQYETRCVGISRSK
jgi:hypothetical protein